MAPQVEKLPVAWQPLTPAGVAAFACARWGRLLLVQLVVALLTASIVVSFLQARWFSVIGAAIKTLPAESEIRGGKLRWAGDAAQSLAENSFLSLGVDLRHAGLARSPAHIQVEFGQPDFRVSSLFGCWQGEYPRGWRIAFNQPELEPWWGAWAPALLALAGSAVVVALIAVWCLLALIYAPIVWLVAFFTDRQLTLPASWRLSGAALMPGALFMNAGLVLYGFGIVDMIQLVGLIALHFVVCWVYLVWASLRAPPLSASSLAVARN